MYTIQGTSIRLTRGDSFVAKIGIIKDAADYTPLDGDIITFTMKRTYYDGQPLLQKVIPNSTLLLELEPSDTADLDFADYVYDIDIVFADGYKDTFIAEAKFTIAPEV